MPYFSRIDRQPLNVFFGGTCGLDRVYINQLDPQDLLVSHSPYYVHSGNGILVGVDERFTHFSVIRNGNNLYNLTLVWKTDCEHVIVESPPQVHTNGPNNLPIPVILMIVSLMYLALLRRIRR